MGTSCPDHFLRTRICPMFVPWDPAREDVAAAPAADRASRSAPTATTTWRTTTSCAQADSPALRDSNPSVVVIPGARRLRLRQGQARSADHDGVLRQRRSCDGRRDGARRRRRRARGAAAGAAARAGERVQELPQLRRAAAKRGVPHRVLGARRGEAAADAAGARVQPEDRARRRRRQRHRPRSRAAARPARRARRRRRPERGQRRSHVGRGAAAARRRRWAWRRRSISRRATASPRRCARRSWRSAASTSSINTAAIYPTPDPSAASAERSWARTLHINVTGNYVLAEEAAQVLKAQNLPAAMVFTSSANAVVPKSGSEAYDVSKAAVNHLIRELAIGLGPLVRVNGIAPATVIAGSSMFPRDRVIVALQKYEHRVRRRRSRPRRCGRSWRSSTRGGRSRAGRSCRRIAPTRSAGWPATRARRPPATSSRSTAGCRTRSCGSDHFSLATAPKSIVGFLGAALSSRRAHASCHEC